MTIGLIVFTRLSTCLTRGHLLRFECLVHLKVKMHSKILFTYKYFILNGVYLTHKYNT